MPLHRPSIFPKVAKATQTFIAAAVEICLLLSFAVLQFSPLLAKTKIFLSIPNVNNITSKVPLKRMWEVPKEMSTIILPVSFIFVIVKRLSVI